MNNAEEILKMSDALLEGHFLLTSGRHGTQYMQCAKALQYPEYAEELAQMVAEKFANEEVDTVLAPAIGGIVWGHELARALRAKSIFAEREDGKMTLRRGFEMNKNTRVVIAEDVLTTGGTIMEVMEIAKAHGATIVGVGVVVDRSNGKKEVGARVEAALSTEIISYTPEECPLCKQGEPIVKPGSRTKP
ncbi:MAG: orotate phosphoribosyltransferase [Defluviitaleaceae bacterium]|nr:orotate phosphoribosyltransferase [Defluviitaleaceae bacterium]